MTEKMVSDVLATLLAMFFIYMVFRRGDDD